MQTLIYIILILLLSIVLCYLLFHIIKGEPLLSELRGCTQKITKCVTVQCPPCIHPACPPCPAPGRCEECPKPKECAPCPKQCCAPCPTMSMGEELCS